MKTKEITWPRDVEAYIVRWLYKEPYSSYTRAAARKFEFGPLSMSEAKRDAYAFAQRKMNTANVIEVQMRLVQQTTKDLTNWLAGSCGCNACASAEYVGRPTPSPHCENGDRA
jgi:hypothetical protein